MLHQPALLWIGFATLATGALVGCADIHAQGGSVVYDMAPDWITDPADAICGLSDPRTLSNPAKVDYPRLLAATPEMQRLEREGIDPGSPTGIVLREAARTRVQDACELARIDHGHCSVWKRIRHRQGRSVPDITALVLPRI